MRPGSPLKRPVSIGLFSEGLLDWDVPSREKPGLRRAGMFGLFRKSLERYASCRGGSVIEVDSLAQDLLSRIDLIVFINPTRCLSANEGERLSRFVSAGGGLLVLGDHTDIGGTLAPLNGILGITSIEFNFDSAMSLRGRWRGCLDIGTHPVTSGIQDGVDTQIGTGASLEIASPAVPIIVGRFAFSDRGDYDNGGRGGNLGNCKHDWGEPFGNLVLVSGEEAGSGRVLVFGDTSPFQNGARFLSQRLISNSVEWLCDGVVACSGGPAAHVRPFDDVAIIDFSLSPQASRALFTERSLGGLANSLYRAGVTPVPAYDLCYDGAEVIFLVAPTRRLRSTHVDRLVDYMRSGGRLVLAKGYGSPDPCALILSQMGFDILPVPLGNGDPAAAVRHKEAWAIAYTGGPDTVTHASAFGHPTIVTRPVGRGTFTLISDSRFLLDGNLESETGCVPENLDFLAALLNELREDKRGLDSRDGVMAWDLTY